MLAVGIRRAFALLMAVALATAMAGTALAASWTTPTALTSSGTVWDGTIATLSATSAIAVYKNGAKIQTRRTIDSGVTWRAAARVSKKGSQPDIAGKNLAVDVVWIQGGNVKYRRSLNGGASYLPAITLGAVRTCSGLAGCAPPEGAKVARGPNNRVVVTWRDDRSDDNIIYARVSNNGGASFGPARVVNTATSGGLILSGPDVAVGKNGVINIVYLNDEYGGYATLVAQRSTNGGAAWSAPKPMTMAIDTNPWDGGECQPAITAAGSHVYVLFCGAGYDPAIDEYFSLIAFSNSLDNGKSWSDGYGITAYRDSEMPSVELRSGTVRITYAHYADGGMQVYYRQFDNELTWTEEELVAGGGWAYPGGVAYFGGKAWVLLYEDNALVTARTP